MTKRTIIQLKISGGSNMDFVKAALKKEIAAGKMKAVDVTGVSVLLANVAGEYMPQATSVRIEVANYQAEH